MSERVANPFKPGFGRTPPYRGQRKTAENHLKSMLASLANGQPDIMETWIYGPRGNGKTELITWFERQISELETPIDLITLDPNDLAERQGLIDSVSQQLATRRGNWNFLENVQFDANIQLPGVGGVGITHGPRFSSRNLVAVMTASKRPILMTLDEAHTASPAVLKNLLDTLQLAGKMIPAGLVLAGTPGLEDTLQATGASYWSRGQTLAIGRLEPDSAAAVLAKPLLNAGFVTKSKAIERLVHVANRYPYFLQLYGRSAFSAVLDGKRRCLGTKEYDQGRTGGSHRILQDSFERI